MTTQPKSFKNISGESRNHGLPMYIHSKIPKSRETVLLKKHEMYEKVETILLFSVLQCVQTLYVCQVIS
jgi:hypothetical protein